MSEDHRTIPDADVDQPKSKGPDIALIYCLIVVAMLAAVAFAVLIVLPYYNHR
jgi:hypothetical protein